MDVHESSVRDVEELERIHRVVAHAEFLIGTGILLRALSHAFDAGDLRDEDVLVALEAVNRLELMTSKDREVFLEQLCEG